MSSRTTQSEYQDDVAQGSEEDLKLQYPSLLCSSFPNLEDEIHLKGQNCNALKFASLEIELK